jgi:hypothetical protein
MLGAFVLLGVFLYWLSMTAVPTAPPEIVEEEPEVEMMSATLVDPAGLEAGASGYVGLTIRLNDLNVASPVGQKAFFVDLPRTPFLARIGTELLAAGEVSPATGQSVSLVGDVKEMNDSTISAWSEAGDITDNDRPLVEFATHYIEVLQIRIEDGGMAASGSAGAASAPSGN